MPRPWKRPAIPSSPLGELNRALHELHHRAGWPSSRQIQQALDDKGVVMSHTTIHAALTNPVLPTKGAVEMITEALAGSIRGADVANEIDRLLGLWDKASLDGQPPAAEASGSSTAETPAMVEPPALTKEQIEAETQLREKIEDGDTEAMHHLGTALRRRGETEEGVGWYVRAANAGNLDSMVQLGDIAESRGDYQEAIGWFQIAAHADQPDAMYYLGSLLQDFVPREKAMYWVQRAAQAGQPEAMCYIGSLLEGEGRLQDALSWYRLAAAPGNLDAMGYLGSLLYKMGAREEGELWLRRGAQMGDAEVIAKLINVLRTRGDHTEADMWEHQRKR